MLAPAAVVSAATTAPPWRTASGRTPLIIALAPNSATGEHKMGMLDTRGGSRAAHSHARTSRPGHHPRPAALAMGMTSNREVPSHGRPHVRWTIAHPESAVHDHRQCRHHRRLPHRPRRDRLVGAHLATLAHDPVPHRVGNGARSHRGEGVTRGRRGSRGARRDRTPRAAPLQRHRAAVLSAQARERTAVGRLRRVRAAWHRIGVE